MKKWFTLKNVIFSIAILILIVALYKYGRVMWDVIYTDIITQN